MIRSDKTRAYCIGATNALFIQRRDLLDATVTVSISAFIKSLKFNCVKSAPILCEVISSYALLSRSTEWHKKMIHFL